MNVASTVEASPAAGRLGAELTEAERAAYRQRGYFVRQSLFSESELERLRAGVEEIHRKVVAAADAAEVERVDGLRFQDLLGSRVKWEWQEGVMHIRSMEPVFQISPAVDALIDDERICAPIRALLGEPSVSLFTDKLNFKRPGGAPFPWHQDAPYWAFRCGHLDRLVSVQIYLDDATEENGCLWMIPGSHLQGHVPPPKDRADTPLSRLYSDVGALNGLKQEAMIAPAGSAIFFDAWVVHGSMSNRSSDSRRALILTYQPPNLPLRDTETVRRPTRERMGVNGIVGRLKTMLFAGTRRH